MDRMTLNISVIFEALTIFEKWFTKNSLDCYRPARLVERVKKGATLTTISFRLLYRSSTDFYNKHSKITTFIWLLGIP